MKERRGDQADFKVSVYEPPKKGAVFFTNGWWYLRPGGIQPYIKLAIEVDGHRYALSLVPYRPDSYPAAKIINRELLRQSALRAQQEGLIEFGPEREDE